MAHLASNEMLKSILPKSELKPITYQLKEKQTLYFGGLARVDYMKGSEKSFVCFAPKTIQIHRTKLENADGLYDRHKTLKPEIESITSIDQMSRYTLSSNDKKCDVVISGLGWIRIDENTQVVVHAPKGIGVFIRESLV